MFYIPDFMEIQTPRAFPNCPERWRDNPESAKDFSPGEGDSPVMHRRIFSEGWSCSSPQSRREWETQKLPPRRKGGSSVLYSGFHGNLNPKGFPKPPGAMAGQSGKCGRFFSRRGLTLPLYTGAFLQRGGPFFSSIPNGMGNTIVPTEEKGGSSV